MKTNSVVSSVNSKVLSSILGYNGPDGIGYEATIYHITEWLPHITVKISVYNTTSNKTNVYQHKLSPRDRDVVLNFDGSNMTLAIQRFPNLQINEDANAVIWMRKVSVDRKVEDKWIIGHAPIPNTNPSYGLGSIQCRNTDYRTNYCFFDSCNFNIATIMNEVGASTHTHQGYIRALFSENDRIISAKGQGAVKHKTCSNGLDKCLMLRTHSAQEIPRLDISTGGRLQLLSAQTCVPELKSVKLNKGCYNCDVHVAIMIQARSKTIPCIASIEIDSDLIELDVKRIVLQKDWANISTSIVSHAQEVQGRLTITAGVNSDSQELVLRFLEGQAPLIGSIRDLKAEIKQVRVENTRDGITLKSVAGAVTHLIGSIYHDTSELASHGLSEVSSVIKTTVQGGENAVGQAAGGLTKGIGETLTSMLYIFVFLSVGSIIIYGIYYVIRRRNQKSVSTQPGTKLH